MDLIETKPLSRDAYIRIVRGAVTREALELDDELQPMAQNLDVIFEMLHTEMMKELRKCGRREPSEALLFWKRQNESQDIISP